MTTSKSHFSRVTSRRAFLVAIGATIGGTALACSAPAPASSPTAAAPAGTTAPAAKPANGAPAVTGPKTNVSVGMSVQVYSFAPIYVAKEKGFFDAQNLNVELNVFKSGAELQQAVVGDAIPIAAGGASEPITIAALGTPMSTFLFIQDALVYKMVAKPEIKTVDDLNGKVMGISKAGSLTDQVVRITLAKLGKDPNMVKYQQAGGSPQRLAALQAGALDATILDAPSNQLAVKAGFNMLVDVAKLLQGFPYEVGYAKKATIEKNKDMFVRYTRGYIKGAEYLTDPKNKTEVIQLLAKSLDMKPEDSQLAYEDVIGYYPKDGMPKQEGLQLSLENLQKYGDIPNSDKLTVKDLLDTSIVTAAKQA